MFDCSCYYTSSFHGWDVDLENYIKEKNENNMGPTLRDMWESKLIVLENPQEERKPEMEDENERKVA